MTINRHKMKSHFFYLILICSISVAFAQAVDNDSIPNQSQTIVDQYNEIINESGSYQEYKVIKKTTLSNFRLELTNSKEAFEKEISLLTSEIKKQTAEIKALRAQLDSTKNKLAEVESQKNSMQFFGNNLDKIVFQTIVFGIIGVLILTLLIVLIKFRANSAATKDAVESLDRTEKKFEEYKRNALEMQQKLGRQLQDEKNKASKLKSGGTK